MVALSPFTNSARKVPLQHLQRQVLTAAGTPPDPPPVLPNQIQLYSFYKPGLEAGHYQIDAWQTITSQNPPGPAQQQYQVYNVPTSASASVTRTTPVTPARGAAPPHNVSQAFEVVAPQFNLDPKLIDSYYPPDGEQDECRILPHVVLNDVHFPWERLADPLVPELQDDDLAAPANPDPTKNTYLDPDGNVVILSSKAAKRNCVPWIALMIFDPEELPALTAADVTALNLPSTIDLTKQPATGAFPITVQQYMNVPRGSRVDFEDALLNDSAGLAEIQTSQETMKAIFPMKQTFLNLFPDISTLRYAAHVRNVNTAGFPGAGINETGLYSIIVSSRMGNYMQVTTKPVTQICHLVSIENFETTKRNLKFTNASTERIALTSLFSWVYLALPPNPVNFKDSIENVLSGMQVLRPPTDWLTSVSLKATTASGDNQKALAALEKRLASGYTLARWRAETGEETAAFNRGPLVPQKVPPPVSDWATRSSTSKEYQILDTTTGIMDLSYSSAWQLGKTLAISDTSFSSALSRFRSLVQNNAASATRLQVNNVQPQSALVKNIASNVKMIADISSGSGSDPKRVTAPSDKALAPPLDHPSIAPVFRQNIKVAVQAAASTIGGNIYNEFNLGDPHSNTDWTIIMKWISEKLYLTDIPAHVLFPDPSFIPEESLRFFYIDDIWMDCLIDGALSVANHLERDADSIREEIKQVYNAYLSDTSLPNPPQIPRYGFILRSAIIKVMPDIRIKVTWNSPGPGFPFCRYIRSDDHTILCLLDRPPEDLNQIELAQPPHNQRFAFCSDLQPPSTANNQKWQPEMTWRQLYTTDTIPAADWNALSEQPSPTRSPEQSPGFQPSAATVNTMFNYDTRVISFDVMAAEVQKQIASPQYIDYTANSAELALELNDASLYFWIKPDPGTVNKTGKFTPRNRQLWCLQQIPSPPLSPPPPALPDSGDLGDQSPPGVPQPTEPLHTVTNGVPSQATNIIFKDTNPVPANPKAPLGTAIPLTCFTVQIWADYKGPPTLWPNDNSFDKNNYLATQNDYLYDLVFSVRKLPKRAQADYMLREIIINIPTTGIASPSEPLIDAGAPGPRARMLSNQRFVPFLNWTAQYLQVRLVPRSGDANPVIQINDQRTTEVSFRLEEVAIPPIRTLTWVPIHGENKREQLGLVSVAVFERYVTSAGDVSAAPAPTNVLLVKKNVKDAVTFS